MASYLNSPAWSVSVEAFFYLTFPAIFSRINNLTRKQAVRILAIAWGLAISPPLAAVLLAPKAGTVWHAVQCFPPLRLAEFTMGMLTARLFLLKTSRPDGSGLPAFLSVAAILVGLSIPTRIPELILGNGLMAPLFCSLIYFASSAKGYFGALFGSKLLIFLGQVSYSVYILQEPVARWFHFLTCVTPYSQFVGFATTLLATSITSFLFVERPAERLMRRFSLRPVVAKDSLAAASN